MAKRTDAGHKETDKVLEDLEKQITKEYSQAEKEIAEKLDDYLKMFETKDKIKAQAVADGKITQKEYEQWRVGQIAVGERWSEMRDSVAQDLTNASQLARSMTGDTMPEVYAINHNYGTFQVEKTAHLDTSYTLYDRDTVQRLFNDENTIYHKYGKRTAQRIAEGKQLAWDKKQVQSCMIQSLLQGESIGNIATRLSKTVGDSDRKASIRNARTMTTGIENAGRVDAYQRAEDMGIELEQEWLATLDDRTRHEHRLLDGQRVKVGEKFKIDGYELEYPADPSGEPEMIYNCRCTLVPALKGHEADTSMRNMSKSVEDEYEKWKESHYSYSEPITKQDDIAQMMKESYTQDYKYLAGQNPYTPNDPNYTPPTEPTGGKEEDTKENQPVVVTTRAEAYNSLNTMFSEIDEKNLGKCDEALLCENITWLNKLNDKYNVLNSENKGLIEGKTQKTNWIASANTSYKKGNSYTLSLNSKYYSSYEVMLDAKSRGAETGFDMPCIESLRAVYTMTHEYGHLVEFKAVRGRIDFEDIQRQWQEAFNKRDYKTANKLADTKKLEKKQTIAIQKEIINIYKEDNPNGDWLKDLSEYGRTNSAEFFAECFANAHCGAPNGLGKAMLKWLEKEGF